METSRIYLFGIFMILSVIFKKSQGHPFGAPSELRICKSMIPEGHSGNLPQKGASPYVIEVGLKDQTVFGGDKVTVWFHDGNPSTPFKGFLVMGQKLNQSGLPLETGIPQGEFLPSEDSKLIDCGSDNQKGAVTHVNNGPKKMHKMDWIAPNEDGDYVILVTIVQDYKTFWVKQRSQPIKVKRSSQSEDGNQDNQSPGSSTVGAKAAKIMQEYSTGCDKTKGCFGLPEGCLKKSVLSCEMFTTFRTDGSRILFQLAGKLPTMPENSGHVSVGLSFDKSMPQASVTGCVLQNGNVRTKSYYNYPDKKQNSIMKNETAGLDGSFPQVGNYIDGIIFCEFARTLKLDSPDEIKKNFDLVKDKYYILLARAPTISNGEFGEKLGYHPSEEDRDVSSNQFSLVQFKDEFRNQSKTNTPTAKANSYKILPSIILMFGIFVGYLTP